MVSESTVSSLRLINTLSVRERQVFDGMVRGRSSRQIAFDLEISKETVASHRRMVGLKLQEKSLPKLVLLAVDAGLIGPGVK